MNPDEQRSTLTAALAICKKLHEENPDEVYFLVSEGRNFAYSILELRSKADRQRLLGNTATHIRATITDNCLPDELPDDLLSALQSQLDVAYTPNGKTYNAYDLGDFITRARESLGGTA